MSKRYLIATTIINLSFYAVILLSAVLALGQFFWLLYPLSLFYILFVIDFLGLIIGWRILKKNKNDKYARLALIINITLIFLFILYLIAFSGLRYSVG